MLVVTAALKKGDLMARMVLWTFHSLFPQVTVKSARSESSINLCMAEVTLAVEKLVGESFAVAIFDEERFLSEIIHNSVVKPVSISPCLSKTFHHLGTSNLKHNNSEHSGSNLPFDGSTVTLNGIVASSFSFSNKL